ncbi:3-dehydroquinate synthase [Limosilactobacillus mucosae]|uniref:3-dehydroquinate synthase n=1 Tax=Limosilactobacillus mucosae TaxID=97478 RepID=UPI0025A38CE2|nr:3-dehydroquinate synthase [Limosilactobacillus mucosae]MDM8219286.1 3-dehydroquinate synthase [Limosilactobacillus mucosae]MDM8314084.1 3-dehydroquinate synthase [Limosilactobacillus mucosae]
MEKISVALVSHQYDVLIEPGLLKTAGERIAQIWSPRKIALISDDNVAPLYQKDLAAQLTNQGFEVHCYDFPAGEASKSLAQLQRLSEKLAKANFNRDDAVIALGGGVTGDLVGFLAATYMRGISLIQIPTSLLAQVDSSVGGKTAVDLGTTKNIIGAFYEPDLVLIDPQTLTTLPIRDLVEGYGEIVKAAAMVGNGFWRLIEQIDSPAAILKHALELSKFSIQFKADIVMVDEKESGQRQLLNFGHTIGHAIEALSAGELRHGEAISIGTVAICRAFEAAGKTAPGTTQKITARLTAVGLPITSPWLASNRVLELIKHDKKNHNGYLNLVYVKEIGVPTILKVPTNQIAATLQLPS